MSPKRSAELRAFIESCDLAVVGYISSEGVPQSAVVGIAVTSQLEVVFDTVERSRKYRALTANARCSVTVWKGERTVQLEGIAGLATDAQREAYFAKLPDGRDRLAWAGITHFAVRPVWIRDSDFGARPAVVEEFKL